MTKANIHFIFELSNYILNYFHRKQRAKRDFYQEFKPYFFIL